MNKEEPTYKGELIALSADFGRVYARRHEGQMLQPIEAQMTLSEAKGHLYNVKGKAAITSIGYIYLNKVASISLVTPQKVSVDGVEQPNPYVERDENKAVLTVCVRKLAIGYSPAGNVTVLDKSLYYNIYTYLIQSFLAKMKKQPKTTPYVVLGTEDDRPAKGGKWAFFKTTPPLGLWVQYTHSVIQECIEEHQQRQRFGDRIAQKIVERNLLKDHPAIGVAQVAPREGKARVTVYGYRHMMGPQEIRDVTAQAERGEEVVVSKEELVAAPEEEQGAIVEAAEEATEESPATAKEPPPEYYKKEGKEPAK